MVEQWEQKLRSEVHFSAVGRPRSLVAVYFLVCFVRSEDLGIWVMGKWKEGNVLY